MMSVTSTLPRFCASEAGRRVEGYVGSRATLVIIDKVRHPELHGDGSSATVLGVSQHTRLSDDESDSEWIVELRDERQK